MTDEIKIPFGFRLVVGQSQKGDGIWDGTRFRKVKRVPTEVIIRKVKKLYPCAMPGGHVIIRRCEAQQTVIPATVETGEEEW